MTMGRASMGRQIALSRSSKDGAKKMADGGLAMISPAAALAKSLQSGQPEGILKMSPIGMAMKAGKGKVEPTAKDKARQATSPVAMKSGGSVRGCGLAVRGKGRGKMV